MSDIVSSVTDKNNPNAQVEYVTPRMASTLLAVTPRTLARLADRGELRALVLPSGHRRYALADITALAPPTTNAGECAK